MGRPPAPRALLGLVGLLACSAADPGKSGPGDSAGPTGDSADSGPTDSSGVTEALWPASWEDPAFWVDPGPLAPLMGTPRSPLSFWELWTATSADGVSWTPADAPIAWAFSSLHLLITPSGLLIAGVPEEAIAQELGLDPTGLYLLTSPDGQTWGSRRLPVEGAFAPYLFDPAVVPGPDGPRLFAYATDSYGTDPAALPGEHRVLGASWDEASSSWSAETTPVFSREGLADPAPCTLNGEPLLFFTDDTREVALARGEPLVEDPGFFWDQVSVPWCDSGAGSVRVVAQAQGGAAPPEVLTLDAAGQVAESGPVYTGDLFGFGNCTAPAVAPFAGGYLLICAVHRD